MISQFEKIEKASEDRSQSLELINQVENYLKTKFEINIKNGNIEWSEKISRGL